MTLLLAGDVGGTKTILRLAISVTAEPLYEATYVSGEFADLVPMVQQFLAAATKTVGAPLLPDAACFALAGPVVHQTSLLTNLGWDLSASRLATELGIAQVRLINDFVAVGYGVLVLDDEDLLTLQPGQAEPQAPIAVIGAGTGLGQGFLVYQADGYEVYGSEGGHTDFAPRTEPEIELLRYLREVRKLERVSVERVVSGQGVVAIYQFLRDRALIPESVEIGQLVKAWEAEPPHEKTVGAAAAIAAAALEKRDRLSEETLAMFVSAYGAEAGNVALKFLPFGGLYLAGGIAAKILPLMQNGIFLEAFSHKGRMSPLLTQIPVRLVLTPKVGLIGAMVCADRLL